MSGTSPAPSGIAEAAAALRNGSITAAELTEAALRRADAVDSQLGVFLARFDDAARQAAAAADKALAAGEDLGPLHGIPVAVKDLLAAAEGATTAHSLVPSAFAPPYVDAVAVARLRAAGAVLVGKTTLSEHAFGAPEPEAGLPLPRNPWNPEHWPGGSSSGTASGLAAGCFLGGLGTDTGGSIRIPAACCGITGLKPTIGAIPTGGCAPLSWSLDTIGPMARSAEDCALLLAALIDSDPAAPAPVASLTGDLSDLRVGVEWAHHGTAVGTDPGVVASVEAAVAVLGQAGASVTEIVVDGWDTAKAATLVITHAEAFAAHRRDLARRWNDYGSGTRLLLAQGAFLGGVDYVQARRIRALTRSTVSRLFETVDVIVTPTVGVPAPRLDADLVGLMPLFFTGVWNLTGHPALSLPVAPVAGLPVGMQVVGRPHDEATVLRVADAVQRRTDWHNLPLPAAGAGPAS